MADEGVIVLEKICSLKNSVKLKLALICGQTCHHICKYNGVGCMVVLLYTNSDFYNDKVESQLKLYKHSCGGGWLVVV